MKKYLLCIAACATLCFAGLVFARGDTFAAPQPAYAKSGGIIGVEGGYGFLNTPEASYPKDFSTYPIFPWWINPDYNMLNYATTTDKGEFVWGIHAGYEFLFAKNLLLGIELGYKDLGKSKYEADVTYELGLAPDNVDYDADLNRTIEQYAVDVLLTGRFYVWQGLNLFVKAGMAYVGSKTDQEVIVNQRGQGPIDNIQPWDGTETIWRFRPEFALGIGYLFGDHINAYVMYDHIGGSNSAHNTDEINDIPFLSRAEIYDSNEAVFGLEYKF